MNRSDSYKSLVASINKISCRHNAWKVFSDFIEMSAIAISNSVDLVHKAKREKRYLEIINSYEKKEQKVFPKAFAHLVNTLEHELNINGPTDILGQVFHELELHNKWKGQFFTPIHICEAMGMMAIEDKEQFIQEKGFITLAEPCVGSGAMVIGFAKAMQEKKFNYCSQLVVTAQDIDIKCVHMSYIQFSLYGIPAKVTHGNSMTLESWSEWLTPTYITDGWMFKKYKEERSKDMSKIFGEFQTIEELNKTALNLRKTDEKNEILTLGQENNIDEKIINKFINKEIDYLAKSNQQENKEGEDLNETAIEKLKRESKEVKNKRVPAEPIVKYLINKCEADPKFSERIKIENKNLKRCFDYVFDEVKKKLEGVNGWVADDEVYQMAETYWRLNITELKDIEIKKTSTKNKKEEPKIIKNENKEKKLSKNKLNEKEEVKAILDNQQVSIFDMMG